MMDDSLPGSFECVNSTGTGIIIGHCSQMVCMFDVDGMRQCGGRRTARSKRKKKKNVSYSSAMHIFIPRAFGQLETRKCLTSVIAASFLMDLIIKSI